MTAPRPAPGAGSRPARPRPGRDQVGAVTAETAVVLPLLALFTLAMVWLVTLGVTQVRVVDGAREAARALARGETAGTASGLARRVAPSGSTVSVRRGAGTVTVLVVALVHPPLGLFRGVGTVHVPASAVAATEPVQ